MTKGIFKHRQRYSESDTRSRQYTWERRADFLVRASGTEPLIRVMAEGKDHRLIQQFADRIAATIQEKLG